MLSVKAITAGRVFALSMMVGIKSFQARDESVPHRTLALRRSAEDALTAQQAEVIAFLANPASYARVCGAL